MKYVSPATLDERKYHSHVAVFMLHPPLFGIKFPGAAAFVQFRAFYTAVMKCKTLPLDPENCAQIFLHRSEMPIFQATRKTTKHSRYDFSTFRHLPPSVGK